MASWWERHGVPRLIKCACSQGQIMKARSRVVPHAAGDVLEQLQACVQDEPQGAQSAGKD